MAGALYRPCRLPRLKLHPIALRALGSREDSLTCRSLRPSLVRVSSFQSQAHCQIFAGEPARGVANGNLTSYSMPARFSRGNVLHIVVSIYPRFIIAPRKLPVLHCLESLEAGPTARAGSAGHPLGRSTGEPNGLFTDHSRGGSLSQGREEAGSAASTPTNDAPLDPSSREWDERFMRMAITEAEQAAALGEVPVGAVVVHQGVIIASAHNRVELSNDPTAHAEMLCIRGASPALGSWQNLSNATLYVTLEPCPMCAGALLQARVGRVVYGCRSPLLGADGSWVRQPGAHEPHHLVNTLSWKLAARGIKDVVRLPQPGCHPTEPATYSGGWPGTQSR
eukprot:jgi/Mesvir1/21902/Mv26059-RA.1